MVYLEADSNALLPQRAFLELGNANDKDKEADDTYNMGFWDWLRSLFDWGADEDEEEEEGEEEEEEETPAQEIARLVKLRGELYALRDRKHGERAQISQYELLALRNKDIEIDTVTRQIQTVEERLRVLGWMEEAKKEEETPAQEIARLVKLRGELYALRDRKHGERAQISQYELLALRNKDIEIDTVTRQIQTVEERLRVLGWTESGGAPPDQSGGAPSPAPKKVALYQFYSTLTGVPNHFYSTDRYEGTNAGYQYDGAVFAVWDSKSIGLVPLHQYWDGKNHFYTIDPQEGSSTGMARIVGYVYSAPAPGAVPIYRFRRSDGRGNGHYYSTSPTVAPGYAEEGIRFYANPADQAAVGFLGMLGQLDEPDQVALGYLGYLGESYDGSELISEGDILAVYDETERLGHIEGDRLARLKGNPEILIVNGLDNSLSGLTLEDLVWGKPIRVNNARITRAGNIGAAKKKETGIPKFLKPFDETGIWGGFAKAANLGFLVLMAYGIFKLLSPAAEGVGMLGVAKKQWD